MAEQEDFKGTIEDILRDSVKRCVQYMAVSAKTAPKAKGEDFVGIKIVTDQDIERLADAMMEFGKENKKSNFDRDSENVRNSVAVLLISLEDPQPAGLNCGACGQAHCRDLETVKGPEFDGPLCAWRIVDLGVAIGSAVKTASLFNIDNRIMYRAGVAAKKIGLVSGQLVLGIPVSAAGKNIFFDRKANH